MSGLRDLKTLLGSLPPELHDTEYVFCTVSGNIGDYLNLDPLATFREEEGLTLRVTLQAATSAGMKFEGIFK
jgi:hypothetical protein